MDYSAITGTQAHTAVQTNLKPASRQITILYIVITKIDFISLMPAKKTRLIETRANPYN